MFLSKPHKRPRFWKTLSYAVQVATLFHYETNKWRTNEFTAIFLPLSRPPLTKGNWFPGDEAISALWRRFKINLFEGEEGWGEKRVTDARGGKSGSERSNKFVSARLDLILKAQTRFATSTTAITAESNSGDETSFNEGFRPQLRSCRWLYCFCRFPSHAGR